MILVTGATGYIGSHLSLELVRQGHKIVMLDNGSNSSYEPFRSIFAFSLKNSLPTPVYRPVDMMINEPGFEEFNSKITTIFHLAGLKSLSESFVNPTKYFSTNVGGTAAVLSTYKNCKEFIFSSSAAVYAPSDSGVFTEDSTLGPLSPYGKSKLMAEQIIEEHAKASPSFKFANLRYFNPVGADRSGLLKENPLGVPNNLMPYISKVALGQLPALSVYGNNYPTKDGTAIRDYIHITDLVRGHLLAWDYIKTNPSVTLNFGSGQGVSVREMASIYETASNKEIPTVSCPPRSGDLPVLLADYSKAEALLGWAPTFSTFEMCLDSWNSVKPK